MVLWEAVGGGELLLGLFRGLTRGRKDGVTEGGGQNYDRGRGGAL